MITQILVWIGLFILGCLSKFHKYKGIRFPIGWDTNTLGQIIYIYLYQDILWGTILVVLTSIGSDISAADLDQKALIGYIISIGISFVILPITANLGLVWGGFLCMCLYNGIASTLGWVTGGDPFKSTIYIVTHLMFSWFVFFRVVSLFVH